MTNDPLLLALIGHLVGDYLLQNDWMALNKKNPHPGPRPPEPSTDAEWKAVRQAVDIENEWVVRDGAYRAGRVACLVHCFIWATCVALFAGWGYAAWVILLAAHYIQDRTTLINRWMKFVGQSKFASGPRAPWSIIVVDNIWHVLQIYAVARWIA